MPLFLLLHSAVVSSHSNHYTKSWCILTMTIIMPEPVPTVHSPGWTGTHPNVTSNLHIQPTTTFPHMTIIMGRSRTVHLTGGTGTGSFPKSRVDRTIYFLIPIGTPIPGQGCIDDRPSRFFRRQCTTTRNEGSILRNGIEDRSSCSCSCSKTKENKARELFIRKEERKQNKTAQEIQ